MVGFSKRWVQAKYPIHLAIYLDILQPIKGFKSIHAKKKFMTMFHNLKKLKMTKLIEGCLDENATRLTNFTELLKDVVVSDNGKIFQDIKLLNFYTSSNAVKKSYDEMISKLNLKMEERFSELQTSRVFKNLSSIDCSRWPHDDENLSSYGENEVSEHFDEVLRDNGCDISKVSSEWDLLKLEVNSITAGIKSVNYLDVWSRIFSEKNIRESCKNSLHIIELLLITPATNAKIERSAE